MDSKKQIIEKLNTSNNYSKVSEADDKKDSTTFKMTIFEGTLNSLPIIRNF